MFTERSPLVGAGATDRITVGHRQRLASAPRCGVACVELAVCLPLIMLLILASLEGSNMLFLRQAVVQSAYETAKVAAKPSADRARAVQLGEQVLASRNVVQPQIEFIPDNFETLQPGELFAVEVSVPGDSRSITGFGPFNGLTIRARITVSKE